MPLIGSAAPSLPAFDRRFFSSAEIASRIGEGEVGGKASGLIFARQLLETLPAFPEMTVSIPRMAVITTRMFDLFLERNGLREPALSDLPDARKAHLFQRADLPIELVGDLRALVESVHVPLAVRSSSRLEDALAHPLAGVYETKMTPNRGHDPAARFLRLAEAVKLVWASTFFASPCRYLRAIGQDPGEEKMAVIIQEVVGSRHGDRFYPDLSGVARSWSFYPTAGSRQHGVVELALGLGKTIVDGGRCWSYSPERPAAPPPFGSAADRLRSTQNRFWAVRMSTPPAYDPLAPDEHLVEASLAEAEEDGVLPLLASTYDGLSDRFVPGTAEPGPRVLDFAPLLVNRELPLGPLTRSLLEAACEAAGAQVEIELAATLEGAGPPRGRFALLQIRPMMAPGSRVEVTPEELRGADVLLATELAMGHGAIAGLHDVVYVRPETFEASRTRLLAVEIEAINRRLTAEGRPFLLIGFGRWGSADPWLGIPVRWDQISGARAVVEAMRPGMDVEPSQGAHFFHNMTSLGVLYLTVRREQAVDWRWLDRQPEVSSSAGVRHVRVPAGLTVRVDGHSGRGVVHRPGGET